MHFQYYIDNMILLSLHMEFDQGSTNRKVRLRQPDFFRRFASFHGSLASPPLFIKMTIFEKKINAQSLKFFRYSIFIEFGHFSILNTNTR